MIYSKVIEDSISDHGTRLVTVEVNIHRFVLAELNTHRKFSRNSASSRAIPVKKQLDRIKNDTAWPVEWGLNKKGMQAEGVLTGWKAWVAKRAWKKSRNRAIRTAKTLNRLGVHKQVTNRVLEPFMWHKVIITSTEWDNFFAQRCSKLAQPEIMVAAEQIREALNGSTPKKLSVGEWHLPYIRDDERRLPVDVLIRVSVARCARVSYLTHDGVRDVQKDIDLFNHLASAVPPHWSPMEHVATPSPIFDLSKDLVEDWAQLQHWDESGNFDGWCQLRHNLAVLD